MSKLLIDVGSTYFKISSDDGVEQQFRDFSKTIFDDLTSKFGDTINKYNKESVHICSSANGGLSTLIIGLTNSFSLKYAKNIAFNSGINIIDTVLYHHIDKSAVPGDLLDVVIVVGGIDSVGGIYDDKLFKYLEKLSYSNIVYVGSQKDAQYLSKNIESLVVLENIITDKLKMKEEALKEYLTNLYQQDIVGKEDIKHLYELTSNQIYSTPYIVNQSLPYVDARHEVINPFIVVDIGGATTDIHYSRDLSRENMLSESEYDRLVFKKLGVYKSKESLIFAAKNNEFVYELLNYLNVTENILEQTDEKALRVLMQLSIFLVLCKVSTHNSMYITLNLHLLKSIVLTGGITKVLSFEEVESIVQFFYKKILHTTAIPTILLDSNYDIWTLGMNAIEDKRIENVN
ncbi:glutamate mutase L [Sulfurospirillum arcachonense]|uniref:glutamate mutase L n=1 Tax=Sulfurospirillum arcachonense TaxID=57666 RepID=UPI000468EE15|nr:glutamate mutase L [Sulfurospirillum arcachonense]